MPRAQPPIAIAELRAWLERVEAGADARPQVLRFGVQSIDRHLPHGGLTLGALHEIVEGGSNAEYASIATLFAAGIAARLAGPVLWCLRGNDLFAPALARVGLSSDRVLYCEVRNDREALPAIEEGLRYASLGAVVGEVVRLSLTSSRRLQLAAEKSGVMALIIRRFHTTAERALADSPTAALTRWRVTPHPSPALNVLGLAHPCWQVELIRCRGAEPNAWNLEACDAQGRLALLAPMGDRSLAPAPPRRASSGQTDGHGRRQGTAARCGDG
jgi:protein ImuA